MNKITIPEAFELIENERMEIETSTRDLCAERARIDAAIKELSIEHEYAIDELKAYIHETVINTKTSVKTALGSCTYVRGRKPTIKWNDAALCGYAVEHEGILQFRSEGKEGKPSTRFVFL